MEDRLDWASTLCNHIEDWFEKKREDFSDLAQFEADFDHLRTWGGNAEKLGLDIEARLIWLCSYPPYHRGSYQKAQEWVQRAYERFQKNEIKDSLFEAHLFNDLGSTFGYLGNYDKQLEYCQKALEIRLEQLGERNPDTAASMNNVGAA